ncbi:MAG: GntR family transcriptional regulator [Sulfitobacter sp.]
METARSPLPRIEKAPQTLRDIVQERMRTAIISGHFAPGDRLVERPLCDQLGVSRTVVRETIRFLEAEGLVEILPNRGPIVARLDWAQAKQIYDIRKQLESAAAMACATVYGNGFPQRLSRALAGLRIALAASEPALIFKASTDFYQLIFEEARHEVAWEIVQRLNGRISRLRALTLSAKDRPTSGLSHMSAIHDAILSRDMDSARQAVETHITDAATLAQTLLADEKAKASLNV